MSARRELLARIRPHRRVLAAATVLGLLGSGAGLAQPLAAREVLEALERDAGLSGPLAVLGALVVAGAAVSLAHFWLLERTAQRVVLEARRGLVARVLRLRQAELDSRAPGDLVARATSDTTLLGEVSSSALVQVVNGAVGLAGAVVLMGIVDLPLLGATACVLAVIGGAVAALLPSPGRWSARRARSASSAARSSARSAPSAP